MELVRDEDTSVDGPKGLKRDFDDTSVDVMLPAETEDRRMLIAQLERERDVLRGQLAETERKHREWITARDEESQRLRTQLDEREDEVTQLMADVAAVRDESERDLAAAEAHLQSLESELSRSTEANSRYEHKVAQLNIELESTRDMASAARNSIVELRTAHAQQVEEMGREHHHELARQTDRLEGELVDALSSAHKRRRDDLARADQRAAAALAVQYMALARIFHSE